ncbi:MAG TPA: hypothetical protein VMW43_03230 [Bacteroidota bacterium]|nr:hypothetical protein [Bacteroidota bacterium]
MTLFLNIRRPITLLLLPCVLLLILHQKASARTDDAGSADATISNIRWTTKGDVIIINYDLNGAADTRYSVDIVMRQESDPGFNIIPKTVEGHIGQGAFAGMNREIRWYYRRDYPRGFEGEGYYFEIHVQTMSEKSMLLYYIIGAAALTGGVAALLLGKGTGSTFNGNLELPAPPARP